MNAPAVPRGATAECVVRWGKTRTPLGFGARH